MKDNKLLSIKLVNNLKKSKESSEIIQVQKKKIDELNL